MVRGLEDVDSSDDDFAPLVNSTNEDATTTDTFNDSQVLRNSIYLYGGVLILILIYFGWARRQFPKLYNLRNWVPKLKTELAEDQFGFLSWLWRVYMITDDEIMQECGLDAACFIRLVQMGFHLSLVGCFNALWLIPVYVTAETDSSSDAVVKTTIANVAPGSERFYATVLGAYIFFGYTMYYILVEFEWYIEMRHKFLKKPLPRHFAVFVRNIPDQYRDSQKLEEFFQQCFSSEAVLEANILLNIPHLTRAVKLRKSTCSSLEHALAQQQKRGTRPRHVVAAQGKKVDSIDYFESRLESLNENVSTRLQLLDAMTNGSFRSLPSSRYRSESSLNNEDSDESDFSEFEDSEEPLQTAAAVSRSNTSSFLRTLSSTINLLGTSIISGLSADQSNSGPRGGQDGDTDSESNFVDANDSSDEFNSLSSPLKSPGNSPTSVQADNFHSFSEEHFSEVPPEQFASEVKMLEQTILAQPLDSIVEESDPNPEHPEGGEHEHPPLLSSNQDSLHKSFHKARSFAGKASTRATSVVLSASTGVRKSALKTANEVKKGALYTASGVKKGAMYTASNVKKGASFAAHGVAKGAEMGLELGTGVAKKATVAAALVANQAKLSANKVATIAHSMVLGEEGRPYSSGFVVFTKLSTMNAALQMNHHSECFSFQVIDAPDPQDVFWWNIGRTHKDIELGYLISIAMTTALCLLWTIPMSFFASLSNAAAVREDVQFLDDLFDKYPGLIPVLEQLAPFLVVLFNALLPYILEAITMFEAPISSGRVEASLFVKLSVFTIIQTFFVSAISGGVIQAISDILDDWTQLIDLLANSLPTQGVYFIQIVLVSTATSAGMELCRVVPIGFALLRRFVGPNLTKKERNKKYFFLRPLSKPKPFEHADFTAQLVLYYMVMFVYCAICPLVSIFTAICLLFLGSMFRHQSIYIYGKYPDSGGKLWANFIQIMLTCMMIAQFTIFGLLGLKKAYKCVPLFIPLMCITVLFNLYIRKTHFRVAQYLPTRDCLKADLARDPDFDFSFLRGAYVQPALKAERHLKPEIPRPKTDSARTLSSQRIGSLRDETSTRTLSSRRIVSLREEPIEDV